MSAYEETRSVMKEKFTNIEGVNAVIEYGTIPIPGISDMDFIAIAEPYSKPNIPRMKEFTKQQRFILSHRPFIFSKSTHKLLRFIDPWILHATPLLDNTEKYGLSHIRELTEEEHYWASIRRMLQWSLGFLRFITNARTTDVLSCRTFLDHCIGIKYFYRELNRMGLAEEDQDPNIPFYVELREKWFSFSEEEKKQRAEEAFELFTDSIRMFLGILSKHLAETVEKEGLDESFKPKNSYQRKLIKKYPRSAIVDTGGIIYVYQENRDEIELQYDIFRPIFTKLYSNEYKRLICLLPLPLSAFSNNYLHGKGVISRQYRSCFITDLETIPMATNPAIETFINMTDTSKEGMANIPLKELFETYGLTSKPNTLQGKIRRVGDAIILWITRTPLGLPFKKLQHRSIL